MSKLKFVFDMDDTLVEITPEFHKLCLKIKPDCTPHLWKTRRTHEHLGIELEEWFEHVQHSGLFVTSPAKKGIINISNLSKIHDVHIVTNRGFSKFAREETIIWLQQHNIEFKSLSVLPIWDSKADCILNTIGRVDYFFDDTMEHCTDVYNKDAAEHIRMVKAPWYTKFPESKRFASIEDFTQFHKVLEHEQPR